jgi:lysozyme
MNRQAIDKLFAQVSSDLMRHEAYREYAYPDPLSKLAKTARSQKWGFKPAREILTAIGGKEEDGRPWTVGIGFTHGVSPDSRISLQMARQKLNEKLPGYLQDVVSLVPNFASLPFVIQTVLLNLCFNLGKDRLGSFRNTLGAFRREDFAAAATGLENSLWFRQVGRRGAELVARVRTGTIRPEHLA